MIMAIACISRLFLLGLFDRLNATWDFRKFGGNGSFLIGNSPVTVLVQGSLLLILTGFDNFLF